MKNIKKEVILFTIIILYLIYCLTNNEYITNQTIISINIWITKILPALFPTFIIIDLLNNSNIPYYLKKYFHINYIYPLSIISGSPSNAYIIKENKDITKYLSITKYTSLIFTYTSLLKIFNKKITYLLITTNIMANTILKIIIKPENNLNLNHQKANFIEILVTSISKNINILLSILGTIIFINTLPLNYINNLYLKSFLLSILEVSSSFNNLATNNLPLSIKLLLAIITISTCGLCIEMQIKSITKDTSINYHKYIFYRLIHLILYLLLTLIAIKIIL